MTGQLIVGPADHGVVRCATELAAAGGHPVLTTTHPDDVPTGAFGAEPLVHLHYTDRLFAPTCEASAAAFAALLARLGAPVSVTLHDLPADDGSPLQARRGLAYATVAALARGVVVSSRHEAARLGAVSPVPAAVVPLPVDPPTFPKVRPTPDGDAVVLGFLYPGKGHDELLAALPPGVGLTALGRPSDGHDDLVTDLQRQATVLGRRLTVTGYLPDDELPARLHAASVPVAPHRAVSASGSIGSWLAAGRRPLVPDVGYVREYAARCPGALTVYTDLAAALARALADPASTWLAPGTPTGPTRSETAAAYAELWAGWC